MAKWVALLLLGLEALYLLAANAFLNLNGLALAFASTSQVKVTVSRGWSLIPGRVHVRDVRLTFQDQNLQFSIDVARASLRVHLSELGRHTFHGSGLRADGLSFRMRHRVDPWSSHEPSVGTFPPIPEFPGPAVFEARVPEAPVDDEAARRLWTVHFDDVDVGVTEVWAQAFRYRGAGRARGQFKLVPARRLWVGPASLELAPGLLSAGAYRIAPRLRARIDCTVHPFDVREPTGMAVFRYISAHVRLDAPELDPSVYGLFALESAARVSSASGSLHADLETRHGVLTESSAFRLMQQGFELRVAQGDLNAGSVLLEGHVAGGSESHATLQIEGATLKEAIAPGYPPGIQRLSLTVVSDNRDTAREFELKEARLGEARLTLTDSSWLNRWLKTANFSLSGGSAALLAHGRYAASRFEGEATLESEGLQALVGNKPVRYAGSLAVQGRDVDAERLTGSLAAQLTGHSLSAELPDGALQLSDLRVTVSGTRSAEGNTAQGDAELSRLSLKTAGVSVLAPVMKASVQTEQSASGPQTTRFQADIPKLTSDGPGVHFSAAARTHGTVTRAHGELTDHLQIWATLLEPRATLGQAPVTTAKTARVDVQAALTRDAGARLAGTLRLAPAAWRIDAGNMRFSGKSELALKMSALDLQKNSGELALRFNSTGVTLGDTKQNADCPWSRVQRLELDASARLLERGGAALSLKGNLQQTELNWGDFLTRADLAFRANFDPGLLNDDASGSAELDFKKATLQSGAGGAQGWAASVPLLALKTELSRRAGKLSGTASLSARNARGRIGSTPLTTDFTAALAVDALDPVARTAHGSGTVQVRNLALPKAPEPVSNWWADIELGSIFGRAEQNLELGGTFRADLRDATPGLAVLAAQGSLPKWVASAFPLRGLSATGSLARRCRLTDIHLVELKGGPALSRGRLQSLPAGFEGALLLRVAGMEAISAGLDFDAEHTHFSLFAGDDWLSRFNRNFDRKSDNAVKLACPPDPNTCTDPGSGEAQSSQVAR